MRIMLCLLLLGSGFAVADAKPLAVVSNFNGAFKWVKLNGVTPSDLASIAHSKSFDFEISFPKDLKLKKDKGGAEWLTVIVADQGSDYKWNQTKGYGGVKVTGGVVKAGTYHVVVKADGIPAAVLKDKKQSLSIGPCASGVLEPGSFTVLKLSGS